MEDLEQLFGTRGKTPVEEAWHKEQERKKYDIIRVKNPTNEDFYVMYDINQYQRVPKNSTIDIPRYIALRYITHMKDTIINKMVKDKHDAEMKERREKGMPGFKSKWEENEETYSSEQYPKTNDTVLMTQIIGELWVGLVYEFGRDMPPQMVDPRSGEVDLTPPEMKILESLNKRRVEVTDIPPTMYQSVPTAGQYIPQAPASPPVQSGFSAMSQKLQATDITNE